MVSVHFDAKSHLNQRVKGIFCVVLRVLRRATEKTGVGLTILGPLGIKMVDIHDAVPAEKE